MSGLNRGRGYAGRRLGAGESRPGEARAGVSGAPVGPARPGDSEAFEASSSSDLNSLLHIDETYRPILDQLERLSPGEDGIALNRKLAEIETTIASCVSNQAQMCDAFRSIRGLCLSNERTAFKCSLAMSVSSMSRTVPLKNSGDKTLRNYYLNVMEETFRKLDVLERSDPQYLVNATNMLGCFYGEARLADGSSLHMLAQPLLGYFDALLRNDSQKAHTCLATQLMQNGRRLLAAEQSKMEVFCVDVHLRILQSLKGDAPVAPDTSPWLLLAADLCVNRFMPLPTKLQHFYATILNLGMTAEIVSAMENQSFNSLPSDSCFEVLYGSCKTEVPNANNSGSTGAEPANSEQEINQIIQDNCVNSTDNTSSATKANMCSGSDSQAGARKPRPILGAGAWLTKARNSVRDHVNVANLHITHIFSQSAENAYKQPEPSITKPAGDPAGYQWKYTSASEDSFKKSTENLYLKQASEIPLEFKPQADNRCVDPSAVQDTKAFLLKRHDLNSWRQGGDAGFQEGKSQAFPAAKTPNSAFDHKRDNWRRTDRNGSFGKEQGSNWHKPQTWGDEDANESETADPAADSGNLGYTKFAIKKNSKENGRWDRPSTDGGHWDGGAAEAGRHERLPSDSARRDHKPAADSANWDKPAAEAPNARTSVLSAPRNAKYWDHDDRLEHDYEE